MDLNILDYFMIVVLILGGLSGYHQGLIRTVGGVVSLVLGLWLGAVYCDDLALYLESKIHLISVLDAFLSKKLAVSAISPPSSPVFPPVFSFAEIPNSASAGLAYLLVVIISFLALYLVVSRLANFLWSLANLVFGWGLLGGLNRMGGLVFGIGLKAFSLAIAIGLLIPLVEFGARIRIESAIAARVYLESSILTPYLIQVFTFLSHLKGFSL